MMYFIPGAGKKYKFPANFGSITSPMNKDVCSAIERIHNGWSWICDNGAFTGKFTEERYFSFLQKMLPFRSKCVFVVAPDVMENSVETFRLFLDYSPRIAEMGYPVAFVAQDGQENRALPHHHFDALFIGGSTKWKLGKGADECIKRAQSIQKWVHVGRVNTRVRLQHFALLNVDSVDGTAIVYKPKKRIKEIKKWMREVENPLFYL